MSLLGEVVSTSAETVSLRLDIDKGHDPGGAYPYPWRPATGNLMYCMPQAGTRVSLYFPTLDERKAQVVNCLRTNGGSCDRMSDPSKRSFVTEHGKELTLYPDEMSLKGGIGQIMLSDADGIKLSSDGIIQIIGAEVRFEAPIVNCSALQGELVLAKTDETLQTAESTFSMSYAYDILSRKDTTIEGTEVKTFEPYPDQPVVGEFDWGEFGGHLLAGLLAVVAVVAVVALVVTGVGAIALAAGVAAATVSATVATVSTAAIGGCVAVGVTQVMSQAISAGLGNTNATPEDTFFLGLRAGLAGAVAGAVGTVLPGGAILAVGIGGAVEGTIERAILGEDTNFGNILFDFGISAITFGVLDGVARKLKKAFEKTAKEAAEKAAKEASEQIAAETAEKVAKEAAEKAAKEATEKSAKEATEKAAKEAAEKASKEMAEEATEEMTEEAINTLTNAQKSRLKSLENTIDDHLTEKDFSGTLRDLQGNPVPDGNGGFFDHIDEMKNSYRSLQKIISALEGSLKNPNLPNIDQVILQNALDEALDYLTRIEKLFESFGGISLW